MMNAFSKWNAWKQWSTLRSLLVVLTLTTSRHRCFAADDSGGQEICDAYSVPWKTPLSSLTPNTMYEICGDTTSSSSSSHSTLNQPTCGDGTPFGFFVARPPQRSGNAEKILIEIMGGGACWDSTTCEKQSAYLTFPEKFSSFIGLSCTEIGLAVDKSNQNSRLPINMLCADSNFGNQIDFTSYNTIIVPYCTQDVHIGDNVMTYDDETVRHRGGHNLFSVVRWIYANFPHPKHIVLTGCSAGGTALPILYDLLDQHYNVLRVRNVQMNVLMDSPVYLTPTYFLENALDHWNPSTVLQRIGFPYYKWRSSTEYPTRIFDHVLKRGNNHDRWGFISHMQDPVSLIYYQWMSGQNGRRRLDEEEGSSQWWTELSDSLEYIQERHKNVQTFYIDSQGHCSFGLYYALQVEGFEEWAASIIKEDALLVASSRPAVLMYCAALAVGILVATGGIQSISRSSPPTSLDQNEKKQELLSDRNEMTSGISRFYIFRNALAWVQSFPFSAGYLVAVSIYFGSMLLAEGFAHPLNNASLGPSAVSLNAWGILNPSLVVYKHQVLRLFTSTLLCSGVLTYLLLLIQFSCCIIPLEKGIGSFPFATLALLIALGSNLLFCLVWDGATCSSLSLSFGLLGSYLWMQVKSGRGIWCLSIGLIFAFIISAFIFAFNSWFILLTAFIIGWWLPSLIFGLQEMHLDSTIQDHDTIERADGLFEFQKSRVVKIRRNPVVIILAIYVAAFIMLLCKVRHPNQLYTQPFFTGCDLRYTDQVGTLGSYYKTEASSRSGNRGRRLDESMDQVICAQFCIPHLASRLVTLGADRLFQLTLFPGMCQDAGYDSHVADKTFRYMSYSLDVEVFVSYDENA